MSIVLALCLVTPSAAQTGRLDTDVYPEKLWEDIEVLRSYIHQAHPDPYRYHGQAVLDRFVDSTVKSLTSPMNTVAFMEAIMPVFHAVGDAHFHPDLPAPMWSLITSSTPLLPLKLRILQDGLFVEEEMKGYISVPLGAKIVEINGVGSQEILARVGANVVTDGANSTYRNRVIEQQFAMLYHLYIDRSKMFKVRYMDQHGDEHQETLFAMTAEEMARTRKPEGARLLPWRAVEVPTANAYWLTFATLDKDLLDAAGQRADKFLTSVLKELARSGTRTVVIDLRGAGGRELAMAELVYAAFAREPFRVVQGMTVRSLSPPERYDLAMPQPEHYANVIRSFDMGPGGYASIRMDDVRLEHIPPMPKAFGGKVYMLCDGMTRDAAAALVMMAKRNARARIIGEEVGTNALSFTGGRELKVTLPNSKLEVRVPLVRYVPEGSPAGPMDHGEMPHHIVEQLPWGVAKGRDTAREALLELIRETR